MAMTTVLAPTQTAQTTTDITIPAGGGTISLYTDRPDGDIPGNAEVWLMMDNPGSIDEEISDLAKQKGYGTWVPAGVYRVVLPPGLSAYGVNIGVFSNT